MNGGLHGGSKSRTNLRSPMAHGSGEEPKTYKKKYEEARDQLKQQKRINEQLEGRVQELSLKLQEYQNQMSRKDRELEKKEEINEVLLDRLKCLKAALAEYQSKKSSDDTYDDKNHTKSNKSTTSNEELPLKPPPVGGYFGSIFK